MNGCFYMLKRVFLLIYVGLVCCHLFGQPISNVSNHAASHAFRKISSDYHALKIEHVLEAVPDIREAYSPAGIFAELHIDGYGQWGASGQPKLPVKTSIIEIPEGANFRINIQKSVFREISLSSIGCSYPVIPAQSPVSKNNPQKSTVFKIDKQSYRKNNYLQVAELVSVKEIGRMRHQRLAELSIAPITYNPATNTLRICTNLEVEIVFEQVNVETYRQTQATYHNTYFIPQAEQVINSEDLTLFSPTADHPTKPEKYVIIADPMFKDALVPFIDWKKQKGFDVMAVYTDNPNVGQTPASIRSFLKKCYDSATPDSPAPSFVLLVGDEEQIPSFDSKSNFESRRFKTDLYYAEYTGDYIPDVLLGRFSAGSVEALLPQIKKTLSMEKLNMPDIGYLDHALLIAGHDADFGYSHLNKQVEYEQTYWVDADAYFYPFSIGKSTALLNIMDQGVSMVTYTGHGMSDYWSHLMITSNNARTLNNQNQYFFTIANCCFSGNFTRAQCLGESFLRAENAAVGYIGAVHETFFDEDFYWSVGYTPFVSDEMTYENTGLGVFDRLFHTHGEAHSDWALTAAQLMFMGNFSVQMSPTIPALKNHYWEVYHLLGDPSFMPYVKAPENSTIDLPEIWMEGIDEYLLTVPPHACIAISKDTQLLKVAYADSYGQAILDMAGLLQGSYTLTLTGQQLKPLIMDIQVIQPNGAYPYMNHTYFSDTTGNRVDAGQFNQRYQWHCTLSNAGVDTAYEMQMEVAVLDTFTKLYASQYVFEDVLPNEKKQPVNGIFEFMLHQHIPENYTCIFLITWFSKDTIIRKDTVFFPTILPDLTVKQISTTGKTFGQAGTSELKVCLQNKGKATTGKASIAFISQADYISLPKSIHQICLLPGQDTTLGISVFINEDVQPADLFKMEISAMMEGRQITLPVSFAMTSATETFESAGFKALPWDTIHSDWFISTHRAFEGLYCAQSKAINDREKSKLSITLETGIPDSISFYYKTSTEANQDFLKFLIDDLLVAAYSGTNSWQRAAFLVPQGLHTFEWVYQKDISVAAGEDMVAIDLIRFPTLASPFINPMDTTPLFVKYPTNQTDDFPMVYMDRHYLTIMMNSQDDAPVSMFLYDLSGKLVKRVIFINRLSLSMADLPGGIYFCVLSRDGIPVITKKIIHP